MISNFSLKIFGSSENYLLFFPVVRLNLQLNNIGLFRSSFIRKCLVLKQKILKYQFRYADLIYIMVSNGMWEHSVPRKEQSSLLVTYMNGVIKHSKNRKKTMKTKIGQTRYNPNMSLDPKVARPLHFTSYQISKQYNKTLSNCFAAASQENVRC